jgi:hypothetical protein
MTHGYVSHGPALFRIRILALVLGLVTLDLAAAIGVTVDVLTTDFRFRACTVLHQAGIDSAAAGRLNEWPRARPILQSVVALVGSGAPSAVTFLRRPLRRCTQSVT